MRQARKSLHLMTTDKSPGELGKTAVPQASSESNNNWETKDATAHALIGDEHADHWSYGAHIQAVQGLLPRDCNRGKLATKHMHLLKEGTCGL